MWSIKYWAPGGVKVARVAAESHNEAVYAFELDHRFAVILAVLEG